MKLNVLAVLLVVMPSTAMASIMDSAWFSLEGSSSPGVTATGGPGQTLVIEKQVGPSTTTLTIGFNISVDHQLGMTGLLSSWGFQLDNIASSGTKILTFGNADFSAGVGGSYDTPLGIDDAGGGGFGAGAFDVSNTGLPGLLFEFDITISKSDSGPERVNILGDFRTTFNSTAYAWYGNFGPVPNVYGIGPGYGSGNNANIGSLPVITIAKVVPEPVTLVLLGAGTVLLLCRRRRVACG